MEIIRKIMAMKVYACPRCLTLSSTTDNGDGGAHTCTPTPLVRGLERRVAELEEYAGFLVHGAGHHDLVFALWNETCGGAAADKAAADLRSRLTELDKEIIALRGIIANLLGEKP